MKLEEKHPFLVFPCCYALSGDVKIAENGFEMYEFRNLVVLKNILLTDTKTFIGFGTSCKALSVRF